MVSCLDTLRPFACWCSRCGSLACGIATLASVELSWWDFSEHCLCCSFPLLVSLSFCSPIPVGFIDRDSQRRICVRLPMPDTSVDCGPCSLVPTTPICVISRFNRRQPLSGRFFPICRCTIFLDPCSRCNGGRSLVCKQENSIDANQAAAVTLAQ